MADPLIPQLPPQRSGRSSGRVFLTSLYAFLLRDLIDQFGRTRLGYLWAVAEPAALVAVLSVVRVVLLGRNVPMYGESPIVFFVFGVVSFFIYMHAVANTQGVMQQNKGLFSYSQIKPIDVMLARSVIDGLTHGSVLVLFLAVWFWLGHSVSAEALPVVFGLFSLLALGLSLGLVFEVYGTVFPDLRKIFTMVNRPMLFISGVFFTIEQIPGGFRHYLTWNPVLHAIDLTRAAVLPAYDSPGSWAYVWVCILVLLFIGLSSYRRYLDRLLS